MRISVAESECLRPSLERYLTEACTLLELWPWPHYTTLVVRVKTSKNKGKDAVDNEDVVDNRCSGHVDLTDAL